MAHREHADPEGVTGVPVDLDFAEHFRRRLEGLSMPELSAAEQDLLGRFGLLSEANGVQRVPGMILGWLLICDPPEQSITQISESLGVSKAAVSTAVRGMSQVRIVERIPMPGTRQHYYRINGGGAWATAFRKRWETFGAGREVAEAAYAMVADDPARRERVAEFLDFLTFLEREFSAELMTRWEEYRQARRAERQA